ncbi:MAG: hypothetical protein C0506_01435 [Anaerolinea sp.]|nr:hypothetical protein [Anaerolinea sp.]
MITPWFPNDPDELTAEWLTGALRASGAVRDAAVKGFTMEQVGVGVGFVGHLTRFTLSYDREEPGAPASLVGKFPSRTEGARQVAMLFGLYEREARVYAGFSSRLGMPAPICYFAGCDPDRERYVVLLEDLCDGRFGDQVAGCTVEEAGKIIQRLAKFHAHWWNSAELGGLNWIPLATDLVSGGIAQAYAPTWPAFMERFGDRLSPAILKRGPGLGDELLELLKTYEGRPLTLGHSDFRVDNIFFPRDGSGRDLVVVDWGSPLRSAFPVYDFIYFVAGGLPTEARRASEDDLLRLYHETLLANGVTGVTLEQLLEDCRASLLYVFAIICVIAGGTLDIVNERAVELFDTIFTRFLPALEDYDALGVLP